MGRWLRASAWLRVLTLAVGLGTAWPATAEEPLFPPGTDARLLARASDAVVGLVSVAVDNANSTATLGPVRQGSGVVIGPNGLVLTIGYLILEADRVMLYTDEGREVPAAVVGYDVATGFGLVKALIPLDLPPAALGDPTGIEDDETLVIVSGGSDAGLSAARRVAWRPFSGYWEYHLEQALFTAPARSDHSGAALFNLRGELLGVGSLFVSDALGPGKPPLRGNMFVPVNLLKPILGELLSQGRSAQSRRAWMGVNCMDIDGDIRVVRVSRGGPAEEAGLQPGDQILRLDGQAVGSVGELWRTLWAGGAAERDVALDLMRSGRPLRLMLHTVDRQTAIKQPEGT